MKYKSAAQKGFRVGFRVKFLCGLMMTRRLLVLKARPLRKAKDQDLLPRSQHSRRMAGGLALVSPSQRG